MRDPQGAVDILAYWHQGRLVAITDPVGKVTAFTYGADGKLDSVADPNSQSE